MLRVEEILARNPQPLLPQPPSCFSRHAAISNRIYCRGCSAGAVASAPPSRNHGHSVSGVVALISVGTIPVDPPANPV